MLGVLLQLDSPYPGGGSTNTPQVLLIMETPWGFVYHMPCSKTKQVSICMYTVSNRVVRQFTTGGGLQSKHLLHFSCHFQLEILTSNLIVI